MPQKLIFIKRKTNIAEPLKKMYIFPLNFGSFILFFGR